MIHREAAAFQICECRLQFLFYLMEHILLLIQNIIGSLVSVVYGLAFLFVTGKLSCRLVILIRKTGQLSIQSVHLIGKLGIFFTECFDLSLVYFQLFMSGAGIQRQSKTEGSDTKESAAHNTCL